MDIPQLTFNPPSGDAITPPTSRTVDRAGSKMGLASFPTLQLTSQPNGGVASSLSPLSFDFTTPTKAGASPKSKSTTKRQAPKLPSFALVSPSKKFSTAETPRPTKAVSTAARTPSPKKVSFADDSFTPLAASTPKHFCASTPKLARDISPKSSPSKPAFSDFSVMSITSPSTPQVIHDPFDSHQVQPEQGGLLESPSKADTTMHDITMLSDVTAASPRKPQGYTLASVALSEMAKKLCAPFDPKLFEDFDFTSTLAPIPDFPRRPTRATRAKQQRKTRGLILEKAIAKRVTESLAVEELDAAVQFRHIAVKGDLAYALCPRKRQRVTDWTDEDYSEPYWLDEEVEERPVINMIEARRVLRNDLFSLPKGPSVREQRQQYKTDMEKYGEVMAPTKAKRNYDGEPKRAYNNGLLTHAIMKPLLAFPMPDLSFEWVLETAIRDSNKAHGRQQEKHRNVRQPIAIFGESDFSVIEEEDEPQSPTAKLPHFPSSATHHSEVSRKTRLDQGLVSLRAKLATFATTQEQEHAPSSPLSSPIGPGFTFEVPSFISSPGVTETDGDGVEKRLEEEEEEEGQEALEPVASPIVYFKDRSQASPFKKRKSLPGKRRSSLTSLLRRVSLPLTLPAADSDQLPVVQDLQDPASGSLVGAPDSSVELPAVQNPSEVDSASAAFVEPSPGSARGASSSALALASPVASSSPSSFVVDARENPDIFGSFHERLDSPIQAPASLAHVFDDAKEETMDSSVLVSKEGDRLMARFKVSEKCAAIIAAEDASGASLTSPVALAGQEEEEKEVQADKEDEEVQQMPDQVPAAVSDDDSDLMMLREFMNRHAARKAAKAAEPAEPIETAATPPLSPTPIPSAPIIATIAATPERSQGSRADIPVFSVTSSAERSRSARRASPAMSAARQPLGALDVNSPSPRKVKRKVDDVEERGSSPEKKPQPPKRQRRERTEKPGKDENAKPKEEENTKPAEEEAGPAAGVRTRAQRAAERGEPAPVTKIPVRHKGYATMRNGEKDLAALTRQNTRTNKAGALPAEQVLESLKNAPPAIEEPVVATARKDGKSVQWAEQLARSRSEEPSSLVPLSPAEEKEVGKTRGRPKGSTSKAAVTKSSTAKATAKSTTKSAKERQPATPGPKTEGAKVTKPKKVSAAAKKELGLSANGTPAKRSARIAKK